MADTNSGSMWDLLTPIALTLGGTYLSTSANQKAAEDAYNARIAAVNAENQQLQQIQQQQLQQEQQQAAPARAYLRGVMATSDELTPAQQRQLADLRTSVTNQINSSPFAGSGRTAAALFKRAEGDFRTNALDQNRTRAISAANTLNGIGATLNNNANNAAMTAARNTGSAYTAAGLYGPNATTANANLMGKAFGDVASAIANQNKKNTFSDRMSAIEKSLGLNSSGSPTPTPSASSSVWDTGAAPLEFT